MAESANAEFFGFLHGRSAYPANNAAVSVEAGTLLGSDYQRGGLRLNTRLGSVFTLYADLDAGDIGNADGAGFGAGFYLFLPRQPLVDLVDLSLRGSVHAATLDAEGVDVDYLSVAADALVSGVEPMLENGFNWYASAGLATISKDVDEVGSDDEIEALLSGGVYLPFGPGDVYCGLEYLDGTAFGAGYRFAIR
ncbi:MAG: hypothetical protein CSB44_00410 [Gammaproteobacteria bacterium]|nr:MAG: hypothetical protein CSB44_00410 [Gammaproteobacteria bacterium]